MTVRLDYVGYSAVLLLSTLLLGVTDQATARARKVETILAAIAKKADDNPSKMHRAHVTEAELNAYIAYRLRKEKSPLVQGVNVVLLENSHLKGTLRFDAKGLNLDVLLGDALDFDFSGVLRSHAGKAKVEFISLHLCGRPVKPQVLDFVLQTTAMVYGADGADDRGWYALPHGIERIVGEKGQITLFY